MKCARCGHFDDGRPGGPAYAECTGRCIFRQINPAVTRQIERATLRYAGKGGKPPQPPRSRILYDREIQEQREKLRQMNDRKRRDLMAR